MNQGATNNRLGDPRYSDVESELAAVQFLQILKNHGMKYPTKKISPREKQVLELITREYTMHEIASHLFISTHTVITHRRNLIRKLEVRNTAGLVRRAFEWGYFSLVPSN